MRAAAAALLTAVAAALIAAGPAAAAEPAQPWAQATAVQRHLAAASSALVLRGPAAASRDVTAAGRAWQDGLGARIRDPQVRRSVRSALGLAATAAAQGDLVGLERARAQLRTALDAAGYRKTLRAIRAGDAKAAADWLLVREFRPPTRFSRAPADATLAIAALAKGAITPARAQEAVTADLLDTYQSLLRSALDDAEAAAGSGLHAPLASTAAAAHGYWLLLRPAYADQHGAAEAAALDRQFARLDRAAAAGDDVSAPLDDARAAIERFQAVPLSAEEQARRAGQVRRFIGLVPIEYGRGVDDGRVTLAFEVQEAITFRDGAESAFADLRPILAGRDPDAVAELDGLLDDLRTDLADAAAGGAVADPDAVEETTARITDLTEQVFPDAWLQADSSADFDVISATLDRLVAAAAAGQFGRAEQARLEAYAVFEFGPEQRLRGIAPSLFQRVEGLFWYGADGHPGLVQLIEQHASQEEIAETRAALDTALADAAATIGAGPQSTGAVIANTAVIVFREGLEAVLILAVLTAGMVGAERRMRRPMFAGAAVALAASAVTWAVAQTVLSELNRYGEKLEAVVSLAAIAVLLLILNWFFHRVYWVDHLAGLHQRKRRVLAGITGGVISAQVLGLALLGFTSVYREGFETVLFVQALVLEAGTGPVLAGVAAGLVATAAVGFLTFSLQQRLPYKRMLVLTGVLVAWVLVVMVGGTVQAMQTVGWLPVHPVEGLQLPYWAGLWFGVYPTWEGLLCQAAAAVFVVGSYAAAEWWRGRRRRRILATPVAATAAEHEAPARADLVESRV